jgi:hypothetical protein
VCLTCFAKARRALCSVNCRYEKVNLWLAHLRDVQVSPHGGPPGAQQCSTCHRAMKRINFSQWSDLMNLARGSE